MYKIEITSKTVPISELTNYYNIKKVHGYCEKCQNHKKNWSCPPHNFKPLDYLQNFTFVQVMGAKIIFDKGKLSENYQTEIESIFQKARRAFGDCLINLENNSVALIAGNCYQCPVCKRATNEACILKNNQRYSIESLGIMVGDVASNILKQELQWVKDAIPDYYLTVGALLLHDYSPVENIIL